MFGRGFESLRLHPRGFSHENPLFFHKKKIFTTHFQPAIIEWLHNVQGSISSISTGEVIIDHQIIFPLFHLIPNHDEKAHQIKS